VKPAKRLPHLAEVPKRPMSPTDRQIIMGDPGRPISLDELAAWLQAPKSTLYRYLAEGMRAAAVKVGKQWRFRKDEVWGWLKNREHHKQVAAAQKHADLKEMDGLAIAVRQAIPAHLLRPVLGRRRRGRAARAPSAKC
jgi:excisionase family DNA binding protein